MKRLTRFFLTGSAVLVPTCPLLAQTVPSAQDQTAQPQPSAPATDARDAPQDIVVTARRREESLQDVPISITAVSGAALQQRGIRDVLDLTQITPSLSITSSGPSRAALSFAIRGQRTQEPQLLTDPPVGTYFAEVVQPRPFGFGNSLYDLQNVQILKGVQGTLFGRNMTGGAILIEPNHPTDRFEGEVRGQYGNFDLKDVYGMINVPLGEIGGFRLAGKYRNRDGFVKDVTDGRDYDNQNFTTFRASLLLRPASGIENLTIFDYLREREHGSGLVPTDFSTTYTNPRTGVTTPTVVGQHEGARISRGLPLTNLQAVYDRAIGLSHGTKYRVDYASETGTRLDVKGKPYLNILNYGVTNKTTATFGAVTFKNIFGYRHIEHDRVLDLDGSSAPLIRSFQRLRINQYSEEFQAQGSAIDDRLNYTAGVFYFQEAGDDGQSTPQFPELTLLGFAGGGLPINPFTAPGSLTVQAIPTGGKAISYAGYLAGTFKLNDRFSLAGGARYNYDKREARFSTFRPNIPNGCQLTIDGLTPTTPIADCVARRSASFKDVTWDATLQYEPSPEITAYLSTRRGYRSGGFVLRAILPVQALPFRPETVQEYEGGAKVQTTIGGARLNSSLAIFYQDYRNVQRQTALLVNGVVATVVTNTTRQANYGGELDASISFPQGLTLGAYYSYVTAEIKKQDPSLALNFPLQGVPKNQAGVNVTWHLPLEDTIGDVTLNGTLAYKSKQHLDDIDPEGDQDAYSLVNMRLAWDKISGSGFSAAVFVNNLFDKKYQIGTVSLMNQVGFSSALYGEPRMYGMEVGFKF